MQKLKQNANVVGATSSRPPIEGMTLKNKGITLIALIITIIVMLILVGVTINVALNGGLFQKADTAAKQTQKEVEKEQLLDAILGTLDDNGKFNLDNIVLPDGFIPVPEGSDDTKEVYKGPSGQYYEVSKTTGKVEETEAPTIPQEPVEEVSFYGTYTYYAGGDNMTLEIIEPDEEGNIVITLDGMTFNLVYDTETGIGSMVGSDMEFAFERKNILDDNGNIINICCLVSMPGETEYMIYSKYGGLGVIPTPFIGKSYDREAEIKNELLYFDIIEVGDLQYGALYIKGFLRGECYYIDGTLYWFYDKVIEVPTVSSDYKTITYGDIVYNLIEE